MAQRSLPVPVWNSRTGSWEPIDFWNGQRLVVWPHGFRQELLPIPEYQESDRVQFVLDECCARDGTVRLVLFQGNISRMQVERGEAIKRSNLGADDIIYLSPHVVMIIGLKPLISLGALYLSNEFRVSCL